jgi:hypothetical protein
MCSMRQQPRNSGCRQLQRRQLQRRQLLVRRSRNHQLMAASWSYRQLLDSSRPSQPCCWMWLWFLR